MTLDEDIKEINNQVYQMFSAAISSCQIAFKYYCSNSGCDLKIKIDDDKINSYEREIESLCMQVLLKEKVYSSDLRKVSGALKMIQDIERIGDHAYDIKWMSDDIKLLNNINQIPGMEEMIQIVNSLALDSLQAFVKMDEDLALDIIRRDDVADKKYWDLIQYLAYLDQNQMISSKNSIYQAHIVKFLERIGDQATNIAEWVVYMINGYHKDKVII